MSGGARLGNLDLNLLTSLNALLGERNVTRAATRLGVSQPAVSAALARLRRHFGDELLYRVGNHYELTPLATRLVDPTSAALDGVERVFSALPDFDPVTCRREFTLMVSDYATAVLAPAVSAVLHERAPGIRMRLRSLELSAIDRPSEALRTLDAMVLPHGFLADLPHVELFQDRWVCIIAEDNPLVGETLTMGHLAQLSWVLAYHRPTAYLPPARQLVMLGVEPKVQTVVENFLSIPFLVARSSRVALLQAHLAAKLAPVAGLRVLPCPFDTVPIAEALWYHPMYQFDPAHAWLRALIADTAGEMGLGRGAAPSAAADERHRGRGDGQELDVGRQR
jgi:DNA-binding transcriptional LysR family regulator